MSLSLMKGPLYQLKEVLLGARSLAKQETSQEYQLMSSSVGESHPDALPEPDVNLLTHPAPIDQPQ